MEPNPRAKQEALDRAEILNERLRATQVSAQTCADLRSIFQSMAGDDINTARSIFTKMCQKQWAEVKDWSGCVKTFIAFKQKGYQQ